MSETVISLENISKSYRLGTIGTGTFCGDLKRWWARRRDLPDPYSKVGETDHDNRTGETLWALKDINFSIQQGEAVGIIGRNGAGKSTLLKILSRVTAPTSGEVKVKGRIASLLEVGTGFHPELTGRENIFLNGAIMGMSRNEIQRKFEEIVDFSGVEKFIDTPVKRYSSGMYVRLAFAVAAHLEPEILIVDEVLAVGDAEFQKKCLGKMDDVTKKQGRTVLFVSHNMIAVENLCSRGMLLSNGNIHFCGPVKDCVHKYLTSIQVNKNINLAKREDRQGNGLARAIELYVLDEKHNRTSIIPMGGSFSVHLKIAGKIKNAHLGILIGNDLKTQLIRGHTWENIEEDIDLDYDINDVICHFNDFPMMHGEYYISVWIGIKGEVYDYVENVQILHVEPKDIYKIGRMLNKNECLAFCKVNWEINKRGI